MLRPPRALPDMKMPPAPDPVDPTRGCWVDGEVDPARFVELAQQYRAHFKVTFAVALDLAADDLGVMVIFEGMDGAPCRE